MSHLIESGGEQILTKMHVGTKHLNEKRDLITSTKNCPYYTPPLKNILSKTRSISLKVFYIFKQKRYYSKTHMNLKIVPLFTLFIQFEFLSFL